MALIPENLESPRPGVASKRAPEHLNSTGCYIRYSEGKGRGVFASREIPAQTVVEISPVLLFGKEEYQEHGRHTVLDHYTFVWRDGRMALALGLGSLFNHSRTPNVSYTLDPSTESIRYTTARAIHPDEELCIFYGHKLWFDPADGQDAADTVDEPDDGWGGLSGMQDDLSSTQVDEDWPLVQGDCDDIIPEEQLPFTRLKLIDDEAEDLLEAVKLQRVWVVDIPEQRHITTMLKWLKQSGLDLPSLSHLKRIRKTGSTSTLLLAPVSAWPTAPVIPEDLSLPEPYVVDVPLSAALTQKSLKHKTAFWPTIYAPRKKGELEPWSRGRVRWAWEAMQRVVREAQDASQVKGELPVVAYVPIPYDEETKKAAQLVEPFVSHDMRTSACHPLRHATLNVIRRVADYRASLSTASESLPAPTPPIDVPDTSVSAEDSKADDEASPRNGSHYLLTGLTLFLSHEPCIMCSMALLHSRVKEIMYLVPMEKTGGCGSVVCLPKLEGVNHRYGISRWKMGEGGIQGDSLYIDPAIDA